MHLLLLLPLPLNFLLLPLNPLHQMPGHIFLRYPAQYLSPRTLPDVHQHVSVDKPLEPRFQPGELSRGFPAEIVFEDLTVGGREDLVVVKLKPPVLLGWLDKGVVVAAVSVAGVDED